MPNSKLGLTNALYNLVINIGDLLVIVLFIMPRVWSALATAVLCVYSEILFFIDYDPQVSLHFRQDNSLS